MLVDGVDERSLDPAGCHRRLGVGPQEPYVFTGTVRDAIAHGRMDATDDEVGAHDVIVGLEGGHNLSSGRGRPDASSVEKARPRPVLAGAGRHRDPAPPCSGTPAAGPPWCSRTASSTSGSMSRAAAERRWSR